MIWLGYIDKEEEEQDSSEFEKAKEIIEKITTAHEKIDALEGDMVSALKELDTTLKNEEKKEWIDKLQLEEVTESQSWKNVGASFSSIYSKKENISGESKTSVFCKECKEWLTEGDKCEKHGSGDNIVVKYDVDKIQKLITKIEEKGENWNFGTSIVTFGRFDSEMVDDVEKIFGEEKCSTILSDMESEIKNVIEGMKELSEAIEEMKKSGAEETSEGTGSDLKSIVKEIKSLKLKNVENVTMDGKRWLVKHHIPGRSGIDSSIPSTIIQDMGRSPMRISFEGILAGDGTGEENQPGGGSMKDEAVLRKVELLKWFYKKREPLYFASDFVNRADVATKVMMEKLHFMEEDFVNNQVRFQCTLQEYSEVHWETSGGGDEELKGLEQTTEIWAQFQTLDIVTRYREKYYEDSKTVIAQRMISGGKIK